MQPPSLLVTISYYSTPSGMLGRGTSYIIKPLHLTAYSVRSSVAPASGSK